MIQKKHLWGMFFLSALILISCEKTEPLAPDSMNETVLNSGNFKSKDNLKEKIYEFDEMLKKVPDVKLKPEDAAWNLEANFNYFYAYSNPGKSSITKTIEIDVVLEHGLLSMKEIANTYAKMHEETNSLYRSVNTLEKWLYMTDANFKTDKDRYFFEFTATVANNSSVNTSSDSWYWGEDRGKCDGSVTSGDAAQLIANAVKATVVSNNSFLYYYTDVESYSKSKGTPDPGITVPQSYIDDNVTPYVCFWDEKSTYFDLPNSMTTDECIEGGYLHACLSLEERIYQKNAAVHYIINNGDYGNKKPRNVTILGDSKMEYRRWENGQPGYDVYHIIYHVMTVTMATQNEARIDAELRPDYVSVVPD